MYWNWELPIFTELEGWIPDTLRLLAVSRTGLSQGDIFTLLRGLGYRNSKEVRNFQWLQFCTCFRDWVYELPSGQIQFSHQHLKEIVEYVLLRKYSQNVLSHIKIEIILREPWLYILNYIKVKLRTIALQSGESILSNNWFKFLQTLKRTLDLLSFSFVFLF